MSETPKPKRKRCGRPVYSTRRVVNLVNGKTYNSQFSNLQQSNTK